MRGHFRIFYRAYTASYAFNVKYMLSCWNFKNSIEIQFVSKEICYHKNTEISELENVTKTNIEFYTTFILRLEL